MLKKLFDKFWLFSNRKYLNRFHNITDINATGFKIRNIKNIIIEEYIWKNIKDIFFSKEDKSEIVITDIKGEKTAVSKEYANWFLLLKNLRKNFKSFDYNYIQKIFDSFEFCEVCGHKTIDENYCVLCGTDLWTDDLKRDYKNKIEYIKEEQLDIYAVMSSLEKVDFEKFKDSGFKKDPNYKLLVSKEEVYKYSLNFYIND